ncbi:MAG: hypothetical protein KBD26_00195 [Candidatus Pacebacteria bacterium]|nr:hypothetical protein [Candidatus Paceibacterota bacterium]MBP9772235.1 hypothetical protein [Candidatus Paceibacterota bacterium]QQR76917.1 MAG: hypothetical protein IPJ63_01485 [Candidatus Nomurabacteria bacterium]
MKPDDLKKIIGEIIELINIPFDEVDFYLDEESGVYWFKIKTKESKLLIGKDGETLKAINYLFRKIVESKNPENIQFLNVLIDVNDYQKNRIENIKTIAHMMAERARYFKSSVEIDPMSSFDRRIIHTFLENKSDIKTESTGTGLNRRVVIKYVGNI